MTAAIATARLACDAARDALDAAKRDAALVVGQRVNRHTPLEQLERINAAMYAVDEARAAYGDAIVALYEAERAALDGMQ